MDTTAILVGAGSAMTALSQLIVVASGAVGVVLVIVGIYAGLMGEKNVSGVVPVMSMGSAALTCLAGACMIRLTPWMGALSTTIFQGAGDPEAFLSYSVRAGPSPAATMMSVVVLGVNILGAYAIAKGTYMFFQAGKPNSEVTFGSIVVHLVGGAFAANYLTFGDAIAAQFNGSNPMRAILAGS